MDELTRVRIDTEAEEYPVLAVEEIGNPEPDAGWDIPTELLTNLRESYTAVGEAELAIMRYVAEHHPDARFAREWLGDHSG